MSLTWSASAACGESTGAAYTEHAPAIAPPGADQTELDSLRIRIDDLSRRGRWEEALPLAKRTLEIAEAQSEADPRRVVHALERVAQLQFSLGDYARSEESYRRALDQLERIAGSGDAPEIAPILISLASIAYYSKSYGEAEASLKRALVIYQRGSAPDHRAIAVVYDSLAAVNQAIGKEAEAERLYREALAIRERELPPLDRELAQSLNNLGQLYDSIGDYDRAEPLLRRALRIHRQGLGSKHPRVAASLYNLALLYRAKGDPGRALRLLRRAIVLREHHLSLVLATGSEASKRAYLMTLSADTDAAVSLHAHGVPGEEAAIGAAALRLAVSTVLRRKGRVLDAVADATGRFRRHLGAEDGKLLDQLATKRAALAALLFEAPGAGGSAIRRQAEATDLVRQVEALEETLSARSAEFRAETRAVTPGRVRAAIPRDAALLEFTVYRPFRPEEAKGSERWGPRRYGAYVLRSAGDTRWFDLGRADQVDAAVLRLRESLATPGSPDVKQVARSLDELLMRRLRSALGQVRLLLVSPDGALHLLPFAALVDERNRFLAESFTVSYLTSATDLVRMAEPRPTGREAVIVADPAFDEPAAGARVGIPVAGASPSELRPPELGTLRFRPLPGTGAEAEALHEILPDARVLTGPVATVAAVKQLAGPRLLHIATHGFFLEGRSLARNAGVTQLTGGTASLRASAHPPPFGTTADPLVRSGLAFAGANRRPPGSGDGLLTALEASGLDLWGTELVVLSACETGLGDVASREGVYGLRRALVMAGAESQVMSLWKVGDRATRELMVSLYRHLLGGLGRAEALRQAQLEMLTGRDGGGPYRWAGFIAVGDWRPLRER